MFQGYKDYDLGLNRHIPLEDGSFWERCATYGLRY